MQHYPQLVEYWPVSARSIVQRDHQLGLLLRLSAINWYAHILIEVQSHQWNNPMSSNLKMQQSHQWKQVTDV